MKTSMLQPAQRKRRTESRIVGQATTDEPRRQSEKFRAMLQHARTRIVGRRHGIGLTCNV
jgi:hypothetical protein